MIWSHVLYVTMINKFVSKGKQFISFSSQKFSNFLNRIVSSVKMTGSSSENVLYPKDDYIKVAQKFIPKLTSRLHKGECGRIGVIGGCLEYTGAPYFAAMSSLKLGADLAYVICFRDAAPVIKSYSPELIVYPFLDDPQVLSKIVPCLERVHSLVIGPGLGRDPDAFKNVESIINYCNTELKTCLPLIIDADGLYLITLKPDLIKTYKGPVILTPNAMEYSRLCQKLSIKESEPAKLSETLNAILLKKGATDEIFNGIHQNILQLPEDNITLRCTESGSLRRCGGQGDVLSGCTAVFVAWFMISVYKNCVLGPSGLFQLHDIPHIRETDLTQKKNVYSHRYHGFSLACYAACCITRYCSRVTFEKLGRSMTASDMISKIHDAFINFFQE